ncbi:Methyltransferase-related protein, putative [Fagus crenata]
MCPLRLILIFLSATLAGFFVLRNLQSQQPKQLHSQIDLDLDLDHDHDHDHHDVVKEPNHNKVRSAIESGFWTCVDMASGRYLWRHLVSSSSKRSD